MTKAAKKNSVIELFKNRSLLTLILISAGIVSYLVIVILIMGKKNLGLSTVFQLLVPLILLVSVITINIVTSNSERRMKKLFDAIEAVADGNLEYQIDTDGAREFSTLFRNFNSMTRELSRTRAELEDFSNAFAHEFNTPISSISGFADYLLETGKDIEPENRLEYLQIISNQSARLAALSRNVLLLTKINAMQIISDKEKFNIGEQVRHCVILLDRKMKEKNLNVDIPEDFDIWFNGSPELMEHVWINILTNAIRFSPVNGVITIEAKKRRDGFDVSIGDNGPGIEADFLAHIFDKYYQADGHVSGNGLGLAIARRAAILNNADISVSSEIGIGSVFTVSFNID